MELWLRLLLFALLEALILYSSVKIVIRYVPMKESFFFWWRNIENDKEIDRESDPSSYWYFASGVVMALAFIPTLLLFELVFRSS